MRVKGKKYFITGCSGFVSQHFLDYLETNNIPATVLGVDIAPFKQELFYKNIDVNFRVLNLLEKNDLQEILTSFKPDYILHFASFSSVAYSWKAPIESFMNNTNIFLNILEVVRASNIKCRILSIGSSEEYGDVSKKDLPLAEEHSLNPVSPYAVARVSQEMLSKVYVDGYGLDIVMTRSFNHIGPRQKEIFVIASFIKQIMDARRQGDKSCKLITGDISIIRDFLDVRDVVRAYHLLLEKGVAGEIYNVCAGEGYSLKSVIEIIGNLVDMKVETEVDPSLIRPNDNKIIIGSNKKIKESLLWEPKIPLKEALKDMIGDLEKDLIIKEDSAAKL